MLTVPIHLGTTAQGFAQSEGMLELHDQALVLRFQSRDTLLEVLKSRIHTVTIPFEIIEEIRWKAGFFRCWLEIRVMDFEILTKIPNSKDGVVRLRVARRFKADGREIQTICHLAIADSRMRRLGELFDSDESRG